MNLKLVCILSLFILVIPGQARSWDHFDGHIGRREGNFFAKCVVGQFRRGRLNRRFSASAIGRRAHRKACRKALRKCERDLHRGYSRRGFCRVLRRH